MKYLLIVIFVIVILVISLTLGAQNPDLVSFNFLIAKGDYKLSTLLACMFGGGFILGWLISGLFYLRIRLRLSRTERQVKRLLTQKNEKAEGDNVTTSIAAPIAVKE